MHVVLYERGGLEPPALQGLGWVEEVSTEDFDGVRIHGQVRLLAVPWTASTPLRHLGPLLCAHRLRASRQPLLLFLFSLGDRPVSFSGLTVLTRYAACW